MEVLIGELEMELLDHALDEGWGAANGPGYAAQFTGNAGFQFEINGQM